MHILILSSWYPSQSKPFLGNFIKRQAELLAQMHKVTVINTLSDTEVQLTRQDITSNGNYTEISVRFPDRKNIFARKRKEYVAFKQALESIERPDIIHAHILFNKGWQFKIAKQRFQCPLVLTDQASYYNSPASGIQGKYQQLFLRRFTSVPDIFIAVSEFLVKDIRKYFRLVPIRVIPNHVDYELFTPKNASSSGQFQFLHISTLDERFKDPKTLLNGVKELKKRRTDFSLTIVSDEPVDKWKGYAEQLGITDQVNFKGPMNWQEVAKTYSEHDAFILSSVYETFSIVIAEALATGIPVISTKVGIAAELDEKLALHFESENAEELADKMNRMIDEYAAFDPNYIREYGKRFSGEVVLGALNEVYAELRGKCK